MYIEYRIWLCYSKIMLNLKYTASYIIVILLTIVLAEVAFLKYLNIKPPAAIVKPQTNCTSELLNIERVMESISTLSTFQQGNLEYMHIGQIKEIALTSDNIWRVILTDGKDTTFPFSIPESLISLINNDKKISMAQLNIGDKIRVKLSLDLRTNKTSANLELLP